MANITYMTAPAYSDYDTPEWPQWFASGGVSINSKTPTLGDTTAFKSDVSWWNQGAGGHINTANAITFKGDNGKDHWQSFIFGTNGSVFPPGNLIKKFQLENTQDSTAGRGLYLRRMGLVFKDLSGREHFWGSASRSRPSSFNKQIWERALSDSDRTKLNGYLMSALVVEVSSQGGSGSRETQVKLGGFKLQYDVGPADCRWLVGKQRPAGEMKGEGAILFQ